MVIQDISEKEKNCILMIPLLVTAPNTNDIMVSKHKLVLTLQTSLPILRAIHRKVSYEQLRKFSLTSKI